MLVAPVGGLRLQSEQSHQISQCIGHLAPEARNVDSRRHKYQYQSGFPYTQKHQRSADHGTFGKTIHMEGIYTQLYFEFIFAVKYPEALIPPNHREELHKYITGVCRNHDQKVHAVFAMPDHVHLLVGYEPVMSVADFMRELKTATSRFINEKRWTKHHFKWQTGYGGFSYSKSDLQTIRSQILNQEMVHRDMTFLEEFKIRLRDFGIEYEEKYLFEDISSKSNMPLLRSSGNSTL